MFGASESITAVKGMATVVSGTPRFRGILRGRAFRHKMQKTDRGEGSQMLHELDDRVLTWLAASLIAAAAVLSPVAGLAQSGEPIRIGYGISLTGPLAPNGKSAALAQKIWEEDTNARGGLLGRPVKLVVFDDQSNPATIPGIYTKLLDADKVELINGPYGTNAVAPATLIAMQRNKLLIGLLALSVNGELNYPRYFSMTPNGPNPKAAITKGFFDTAIAQNPRPQTVAIIGADAEFSRNAADGARENAGAAGLKIVYDKTYPPTTSDFAPIVRAIAAGGPDVVVICSYPLDSVGMVRAINEVGFKPKMIGGGMVGLQSTAFKLQLGPLLNGFVNFDFWLPVPKLDFPGTAEFMRKYQARAAAEGVDPLGYFLAPWGYAQLQVLGQAIEATKSLDDGTLADHIHRTTFKTVGGDIAFESRGEWAQSRVLQVQFQGVKGNDLGQFKDAATQVVVTPAEYKSGEVIYPFEKAR
jgi:branched-chain amino acid transport system substrate-binding protein